MKNNRDFSDDVKIHINKLHQIVQDSIEAEELIVNKFTHPAHETLSRAERISDRVAKFGGSWKFIIAFVAVLILWMAFNVIMAERYDFDPYPFILLNLVLSCIAALQAPIIMMSQNRQEQKDRVRSENDYLINLKAEMQIRSLHQKVDLLLEEEIKTLLL
jgi:uncharacterized membrane protein